MKKTILVIGGNGFIGTNLSYMLAEEGNDVISFDLVRPARENPKIQYIEGDFFDDQILEKITEKVDVIIHAISTVNPGNSNQQYMRGYAKDFIQTIKLCELVIQKGIRMIFLSSGGTVYGNPKEQPILEDIRPQPINHYGNIKLCIENTIRTFNTQLHTKMLIARISNPYGPGQDYHKGVGFIDAALKKAMAHETIEIWGDGKTERDYIYIEDACKMVASLIDYKGQEDVFNISINRGASQNEILDIVKNLGIDFNVEYKESRSVDAKRIILDNRRIREIYPNELVSLEEGIERYYKYLLRG
ncbi:MAG: NAD-dependent epimerase/dehydratase family protein [Lachnospiraceae bacterium]|nr:NAD-dependent epimerase/dehydratase family protein [Lachnospiraceae bacterium]